MNFSLAKEIFGSTAWFIDSQTYEQYLPVVQRIENGIQFTQLEEPENMRPFAISAISHEKVQMNSDGGDYTDANEDSREKVIHVLSVRDIMMKHDTECGPRGMRTQGNRLRKADSDSSVIGHIIIFETGGGSADSVPEIADAIMECKKPVVAWVDGYMASAGMYAGSYCHTIIASREFDRIGSIGTMGVYRGRKKNSGEDLGNVVEQRFYATDSYEKNQEYEEAINNSDPKLAIQRILDPFNAKFVADIKANRPNVKEEQLHGRTYDAIECVGTLIDKIGDFNEAINEVMSLANDNQSQTGSQTQQTSANMKQFEKVNAALSVESLESADGYVSLNEEQLEAIDQALTANATAQTDLEAERAAHQQTQTQLTEAQEQITNLQNGAASTTTSVVKETDESAASHVEEHLEQEDIELFNSLNQ